MLRELRQAILRFRQSTIATRQRKLQIPGYCDPHSTCLAQLEERVLYSAAPLEAPQESVVDVDVLLDFDFDEATGLDWQPFDEVPVLTSASSNVSLNESTRASELIIVDANLEKYQELVDGIVSAADREFEIVFLQDGQDGVDQISDILDRYSGLDALHIVTHGSNGSVRLADSQLTTSSLDAHAGSLARWNGALSSGADLLFYGCDLASTDEGEFLVEAISELTGADVAASDDLTGHRSLGGDWIFEYVAGTIETANAFSASVQESWFSLLVATANNDSYSTAENAVINESAPGVLDNDTGGGTAATVVFGAMLEYDASLDTNGNSLWEDSTGITDYDWSLDPAIVRDTSLVGAPSGITAAYVFDGSSRGLMSESFQDLAGDPSDGDASFELWFRPDSPSDNRGILLDIGSEVNGTALRLYQSSGDSFIEYVVSHSGSPDTYVTADITTEMDSGDFIQIVATVDVSTGTTELFVNGTSVGSTTEATLTKWTDNSEGTSLGDFDGTFTRINDPHTDPFHGEIAIFRFYEMALTALEVQGNYDAVTAGGSGSLAVTGFDATSTAGATVNVAADGSFSYDPGTLFDYLKDGESVIDTFTYAMEDAMSSTDMATVSITVNGATEAPTAITPNSFNIEENTNTTGGYSLGTLNATDEDSGETFTYSILPGGDSANFSIGGGGDELILTDGMLDHETKSSYSVDVRVTDSGGNTYDETITVDVNDRNEWPTGLAATNFSVDENTDTSSGYTVGTLVATDPDVGDSFVYVVQPGVDGGKFTIGGAGSDELILTDGILDFENQSIYWVKIRVLDSGGEWIDEWVSVDVNDLNQAPTEITPTSFNIDENTDTSGGYSVGTLVATDEDSGESFTYSIVAGGDSAKFTIGGAGSDELILTTGVLNHEAKSSYVADVQVTDGGGNTYVETITVDVNDLNETPTAITPSILQIADNTDTSGGFSLGILAASDEDSPESFIYSIQGGADAGNFTIGGAGSDELILSAGLVDESTKSFYSVLVRVTDGGGNTYDETISVNVIGGNDPPTISNEIFPVDENSPNGTIVGSVTASDADPEIGYTKLYWVDVDTDDVRRINLDGSGGELLASQPDGTDATGTRGVTVDAVNGKVYWGNNNSDTIWIADLNGDNAQPLISGLDSPQGIAVDPVSEKIFWVEGMAETIWHADLDGGNASLLIGSASNPKDVAVDSAAGKIYWTDDGTNEIKRANLDGGSIQTIVAGGAWDPWGIALDVDAGKVYWSEPNYNEIYRADMVVGATPELVFSGANEPRDLTLDVVNGVIYWAAAATDQIEGATFAGSPIAPVTGTGNWPTGIAIGPDAPNLTYAITNGNTGGAFSIDSISGEISVANNGVLNFESSPVFNLTVEVTDNLGLKSNATVTINLNDVNEAPTAITPTSLNINENVDTSSGTLLGRLSTADVDDSDTFSYAIAGGADSVSFSIGGAGDELILTAGVLNHEAKSSYVVDIEVTDGGGNTYVETITVDVNDLNETPTAFSPTNANVDENTDTSAGYTVATLSTTDPDDADSFSYAIAGGADSVSFSIGGTGDELILTAGVLNHEAKSSYVVDIEVTDGGGNTYVETITVDVNDLNETPTAISPTNANVDENTDTSAGYTVATLSTTDPDDADSFSYAIAGGADSVSFSIGGTGDELILTAGVLNHEAKSSYVVDIEVTDGGGNTYVETITVDVNDLNETPTAISPTNANVDENTDTSAGYTVATLSTTDPDDADSFSYAIAGGADSVGFSIGGAGDELILTAGVLNHEAKSSYVVDIEVTDGGGNTYVETITVDVNDLNETPTAISPTNANVDENTDTWLEYTVATLSTTDPDDADSFSYAIAGGADSVSFSIGGTGDELILTAGVLNHEAKSSYVVDIEVTDGGGNTYVETITVDVNDLNETPTAISPTNANVDENTDTSAGYTVATLSTTDPDDADSFSYAIAGGADSVSFSIGGTGDELILTAGVLNHEAKSSYVVDIEVTDGGGNTYVETITVDVDDLNETPTGISPSNPSVDENTDTSGGYTVATLTTMDPDDSDTFSYAIAGGADSANFTIGGAGDDELILTAGVLNHEAQSSYVVDVEVADGGGNTYVETITVDVNDLNDTPTAITPSAFDIDENTDTASGFSVGTLDAVDEDVSASFTYSILGGPDASSFTVGGIGNDELILTAGTLNHEIQDTYFVMVRVVDTGGSSYDELVTVSVNDLNETPTAVTPTSIDVAENIDSTGGLSFGKLNAVDEDFPDSFTYSIQGGPDATKFSTGGAGSDELILTDGLLDHESQSSYTVIVRVTDSGGNQYDETITVTVDDLNESPTAITPNLFDINENTNTTGGISLGQLNTVDEDSPESFTYSIQGGADAARFSIGGTGLDELILADGQLDHEAKNQYLVVVRVTDSAGNHYDELITVDVNDLNDVPTVTALPLGLMQEDAPTRRINLRHVFADAEDLDRDLMYSIVNVSNPGLFDSLTVNASDRLVINLAPDQNGASWITVRATDTGGAFVEATFQVQVAPVNDQPFVENPVEPVVVDEDAPDTYIGLVGVFNDVDIATNGDELNYQIVANSNEGLVAVEWVGNQLRLDYQDDAFGAATITVEATDKGGKSTTEEIQITVNPVQDPTIVADDKFASVGKSLIIDPDRLLANDYDVDSKDLSVVLVDGSEIGGKVSTDADGNLIFTPTSFTVGTASFQYVVVADGVTSLRGDVDVVIASVPILEPAEPNEIETESEEDEDNQDDPSETVVSGDGSTEDEDELPFGPAPDGTVGTSFADLLADDIPSEFEDFENSSEDLSISSRSLTASYIYSGGGNRAEFSLASLSRDSNRNQGVSVFDPILAAVFWEGLDSSKNEYLARFEFETPEFVAASAGILTLSYLAWLINGGVMLTSFVSSLGGHFDPLPLVESGASRKDQDGVSVEQLVENENSATG